MSITNGGMHHRVLHLRIQGCHTFFGRPCSRLSPPAKTATGPAVPALLLGSDDTVVNRGSAIAGSLFSKTHRGSLEFPVEEPEENADPGRSDV